MRIIYFAYSNPITGGDFVNIEHVLTLQKHGFDTFMIYPDSKADNKYLPHNSQPMNSVLFTENDVLVIPENNVGLFDFATKIRAKTIIHNQNTYYFLNAIDLYGRLDKVIFNEMICPSYSNALTAAQSGFTGKITTIHPSIPAYFKPQKKQLKIGYSTKKRPVESTAVKAAFQSMYPELENIEWIPLVNMTRAVVAEVLSECAIYASFAHLEAVCLSVVEAMKSGCIVVGDHGGGGFDYATHSNGLWCSASDTIGFAQNLKRAVDIFINKGDANSYSILAKKNQLMNSLLIFLK